VSPWHREDLLAACDQLVADRPAPNQVRRRHPESVTIDVGQQVSDDALGATNVQGRAEL
jgi:hypothetical protein